MKILQDPSDYLEKLISDIKKTTLKIEKFAGSTTRIPDMIDRLDEIVKDYPEGQAKVVDLYNWLIKNRGHNKYIPWGYVANFSSKYVMKTYVPREQHIKDRYERIAKENLERSINAKAERDAKRKVTQKIYKKKSETINNKFYEYQSLFQKMNNKDLITAFNKEVGNNGWTTSRSIYIAALREELNTRKFDSSLVGKRKFLSFAQKVKLVDNKIEYSTVK